MAEQAEVLATDSHGLGSTPGTHNVEGENRLLQ